MSKDDKVGQALRGLEEASRGTLVAQWRRHYRSEPPRYASVEFMRQAIAYAIQERELGGLPASAERELLAIAKGTHPTGTSSKIKIKPGTKLLREWDGNTHEVLVTDKGFVWNGTTHSRRASLRYRYYVSQTLVIGRPRSDVPSKRWRIPASEIENAVLATLTSFLDDQSELTSIFQLAQMTPVEATAVLEAATSLSLSLGNLDLTQFRKALQSYVTRVEIGDATIAVTLNLAELHHVLRLPAIKSDEPQTHTIVTPVRVTKRGVEQRLVIGRGVMTPVKRDETLVKALARAYAWFEDIRIGKIGDLSEIATRENLPRSYVQAHLPLAFLAPKIVQAILDGKQPADLSAKKIMYRTDLSVEWAKQTSQLGFADLYRSVA